MSEMHLPVGRVFLTATMIFSNYALEWLTLLLTLMLAHSATIQFKPFRKCTPIRIHDQPTTQFVFNTPQ